MWPTIRAVLLIHVINFMIDLDVYILVTNLTKYGSYVILIGFRRRIPYKLGGCPRIVVVARGSNFEVNGYSI